MLDKFFYNSLGDFQWASIAAILSFVGIIATISGSIYTHKKSLKAQIKSTTKVEWLNKIIELSAEYINDYQLIGIDIRNIYAEKVKKSLNTFTNKEDLIIYDPIEEQRQRSNLTRRSRYDENINKFSNDFNERMRRINYKASQLKIYFMDEPNSEKSKVLIDDLRDQLVLVTQFINNVREDLDEKNLKEVTNDLNERLDKLDQLTDEFGKSMSMYLSSEVNRIENQI
ncbi:hypothetical protein [uncultured Vagococcus sp.]|uniref:hypothetical protein n=1 Tax=uncultured Vagococcus sp. TaxID=189676 RepID=UPI00258D53E2|nr:hypothetical protein [uncultured Vagococcus sp.]